MFREKSEGCDMTYINPLAGALASSNQVARAQSEDKTQQLRRVQAQKRVTTPGTPDPEQTVKEVESFDSVILQTEEEQHEDPRERKRKRPAARSEEEPPEALDIRA